jgi:hypothetical protein
MLSQISDQASHGSENVLPEYYLADLPYKVVASSFMIQTTKVIIKALPAQYAEKDF